MLTPSVQDLPVILKWYNFQSLVKALNLFKELKFCKSDVYFLNRRRKCVGIHLKLRFSVHLGEGRVFKLSYLAIFLQHSI